MTFIEDTGILKRIALYNIFSNGDLFLELGLKEVSESVYLMGNILFDDTFSICPLVYIVKDLNVDFNAGEFYTDNFLLVFKWCDISPEFAEYFSYEKRWVESGPWVKIIDDFADKADKLMLDFVFDDEDAEEVETPEQKAKARLDSFKALFEE